MVVGEYVKPAICTYHLASGLLYHRESDDFSDGVDSRSEQQSAVFADLCGERLPQRLENGGGGEETLYDTHDEDRGNPTEYCRYICAGN